tara:strand:- start:108 stop:1724 length:1617 start_codon:yes stop_codon:yes gene_type:complete
MYNVNAENPLIDQYGIGKGEAQIIDPSILIRQQEVAAAKQERAAAAKAKKEEEKAADIQAQIAGMKTGDIMPHDSNLVKEKLQAMRDYAVKNADKLMAGDMEAQMGFDAVKNDAGILIANSIDKKNNYAATAKQVSEHERDYLPGTLDKLLGFAGTDYAGQQFIPTKFAQANTDLDAMANKIVDERLKISAQPLTEIPTGYGATKTTQENIYARDSAINDMEQAILSDPVAIHKAAWELHNDPKISADDKKKLYGYDASIPDDLGGAKIEKLAKYAAEKRADRMVYNHSIDKRSAGWKPESNGGFGGISTKTRVNFVPQYDDSGSLKGGTMAYADPQNDPPVTHYDYGNKNKQVSVKPISFNIDKNIYEVAVMKTPAELKEIEKNKAINQEREASNAGLKRDIDAIEVDKGFYATEAGYRAALKDAENEKKYYLSKVKPMIRIEPEETIKKVSADYFNEVFGKKYGGSISEVQKRGEGGLPSNFYVTEGAKGKAAQAQPTKKYDYSKAGLSTEAKKRGISVDALKTLILKNKPKATFE